METLRDILQDGLPPALALILSLVFGGFAWLVHTLVKIAVESSAGRAGTLALGVIKGVAVTIIGVIVILGMPPEARTVLATPHSATLSLDQLYDAAVRRTALRDPALFQVRPLLDVPVVLPPVSQGTPTPACQAEGGCVAMVAFRDAGWGERVALARTGPDGARCDPGDQALPRPGLVLDGDRVRTCRPLWLTAEQELRRFCPRDGRAADLTLRQTLGLPPGEASYRIYRLTVSRDDLIRPCVRPTGLSETSCVDPQNPRSSWPAGVAQVAGEGVPAPSLEQRAAYFALVHGWNTTQEGLGRNAYPFTGLGWTYNWNPDAPSIVGVTELVLQETASFSLNGTGLSAEEFCRAP